MNKVQVIRYKCCGKIFAACIEPHCYEDADWQRDMRKYIKQGHAVETVDKGNFKFEECECNKSNQLELL